MTDTTIAAAAAPTMEDFDDRFRVLDRKLDELPREHGISLAGRAARLRAKAAIFSEMADLMYEAYAAVGANLLMITVFSDAVENRRRMARDYEQYAVEAEQRVIAPTGGA